MRKKICSLATAYLAYFAVGHAQVNLSPSLQEAVSAGLEKNVKLKNQGLDLEKMALAEKEVRQKYLPRLSAIGGYAYFSNTLAVDIPTTTLPVTGYPLFAGATDFRNEGNGVLAGVTLKQVVFSGGQILNGAKALGEKRKGNALLVEASKEDIIKEIITSFDQLKLLDAAQRLISESEIRLKKETERVEKAISLGLAIPYDRDKIKLARLELDSKSTEVAGKRAVLYQKIAVLTGYNEEQIKTVVYDLDLIKLDNSLSTDTRSELKAFGSFKNALNFNLKKEKGSLLPTIGAFAGYSYASMFNSSTSFNAPVTNTPVDLKLNRASLSPNWAAGVVMKWELFSGMERAHKIKEAKIDIQQLDNKRSEAKELMDLQLKNNLTNYTIALRKIDIADQKEVIASNNLHAAEKQYRAGLISISERLTAETDLYNAALNKVEAAIDQRKSALECYVASGTLQQQLQ